jgi:outer membrane protein TolC
MMKLDQGRFTQSDFQINNLNNPGTQQNFKTAVVMTLPLFDPSISPARDIAAKDAESLEIVLESSRQEAAFRAFRLYLEVQKAKAKAHATEAALNDARENLRLAKIRTEAGTGLRSDELRARTYLAAIEQNLLADNNTLTLLKMQLENLLGFKEGENIDVDDAVAVVTPEKNRDDLVRVALDNRSDLQQTKVGLEKADAEIRRAKRSYLPSVTAFAGYQLNARDIPFGSDNDSWIAGGALTWQVFDGFSRRSEYGKAVANRSASSELFENRQKDIRYSVRESLLKHDEAVQRLEVARRTLKDAEETVRLISRRYENSLATMFELLDAQTVLNQTRAGLIENEADLALSGGQVYYATGTFLKEMSK